ncbi:MAG: metallophosphoesterase [Clostridia bacterium]|nr:metallophosphoesterase [Clostridia bacterium]
MKDDFAMIVHRFDTPITIYPIADVHYGAIMHEKQKWLAFCRSLEAQEDARIILNGDLINNNTRSAIGSPFDDVERPRDQKVKMVEMLSPIKDKILCLTSGNHERRSMKDADDDPTYDIAAKLDLEDLYRPNIAFLKIGIGGRNRGNGRLAPNATYVFAVTHGNGGGIYTGGTVNRNERFGNVIDNLDCLVVGHTHKATVTRPSKICVDVRSNKVVMRDYLVISCTSWQRYGEYAVQKMLLPSSTSKPQKILLDESGEIGVIW